MVENDREMKKRKAKNENKNQFRANENNNKKLFINMSHWCVKFRHDLAMRLHSLNESLLINVCCQLIEYNSNEFIKCRCFDHLFQELTLATNKNNSIKVQYRKKKQLYVFIYYYYELGNKAFVFCHEFAYFLWTVYFWNEWKSVVSVWR